MALVRQAYGAVAAKYIELFGNSAQVHVDDLAFIVRYLSIRPGVVLDVGCGPGHLTAHLRSHDVNATGIDLTPEFIDHARAAYPDGHYEIGTMASLPVANGSVAGILAWYSLIHLSPDDLDAVLDELRRASAPGAQMVIGFFDGPELSTFEHKVVLAYHWPVDEFSDRLRRAGFLEIARYQRSGDAELGLRSHAAMVASAC